MIYIVDLSSSGNSHLLYNVSIIKVLIQAHPDQKFSICVQQSHWDLLSKYFSVSEMSKMIHNPAPPKKKNKTALDKAIYTTLNTLREASSFLRLLRLASGKTKDFIFICTAHPVSLLAFRYIKKFFPDKVVISTIHGEIEFLYYAGNKWERNTASIFRKIFKIKGSNFIYLFLNKISRTQLIQDQYINTNESIEIDHPYIYNHQEKSKTEISPDKITIAHVGSMGVRKSAHLLYELAEMNKQLIEDNLIDFWNIGPIEDNVLPYKSSLVKDFTSKDGKTYIPRTVFDEKLRLIDYAVFFYNTNQFIFRASGAVHDVINFDRPIIVLKHPYFDYLFRVAGNIGFICNDLTEMSILIERLVSREDILVNQYEQQCHNISSYKKRNDISFLASDFKNQLATLL